MNRSLFRRTLLSLLLLLGLITLDAGPVLAAASQALVPVPDEAVPPPPPPPQPRQPRGRQAPVSEGAGIGRFYIHARPFVGIGPFITAGDVAGPNVGAIFDVGVEYNAHRGIWVGAEVAPLVISRVVNEAPLFNTRINLGYSGRRFGIGANLNGSFGSPFFAQLGPIVRIGSLAGTYVRLRFAFGVFFPSYFPVSGDLQVNVRLVRRLRLVLEAGGDAVLAGLYGSAGVQLLLRGDGIKHADYLNLGVGVSAVGLAPGPMATVGYEHRW